MENLLKKWNISYKIIDEDKGVKLYKINGKLHLMYLHKKGNAFALDRDFFEFIDNNAIPYSIVCHDTAAEVLYYLKLNKNVNWIKSCFATCDKQSIFLGKQVLNNRVSELELQKELLRGI